MASLPVVLGQMLLCLWLALTAEAAIAGVMEAGIEFMQFLDDIQSRHQ